MSAREFIQSVSQMLAKLAERRRNGSVTGCADCPIVMRCGLEPQAQCLGRVEAIARGDRREPGPWDSGLTRHYPHLYP